MLRCLPGWPGAQQVLVLGRPGAQLVLVLGRLGAYLQIPAVKDVARQLAAWQVGPVGYVQQVWPVPLVLLLQQGL